MPAIIAFPAGLILGSFVTVLAHRVPRRAPFVLGRSECTSCGSRIAAYDNIPIVSWMLLRGRCRGCGERISMRYPLAELGLGLLYLGTVLFVGTDHAGELALGLVLCTVLVTVTLTDLELRVIPNSILLWAAAGGAAILALSDPASLPAHLLAAGLAGGALFLVALAYPRGMGMGDVKLVAVMGLYLGRAVAPALLVAFAVGALVGVAMMLREGAGARKQAIPFGPFLALGGVVGLWFGDELVQAYLDAFVNG